MPKTDQKKRPNQFTVTLTQEGADQLHALRESSGLNYSKVIELGVRKLYASGDLDLTKS